MYDAAALLDREESATAFVRQYRSSGENKYVSTVREMRGGMPSQPTDSACNPDDGLILNYRQPARLLFAITPSNLADKPTPLDVTHVWSPIFTLADNQSDSLV